MPDDTNTSAAIDALSGGPPPPPTGPYATANLPPQATSVSPSGGAVVPDAGVTTGPVPGPPTPAGQPSVWKSLVMGALSGLAGSAGSTHFGGGLARGAGGYLQEKQQEAENAQKQQLLQMESLKASDSHAMALQAARRADLEDELTRIKIGEAHDAAQEFAEEHGQPPKLVISADNEAGMHAQAVGGLATLAAQNPDGKVPEVVTTNSPFTAKDPNHEINAYSTFAQDVTKNSTGVLNLINQERATHKLPPLDYQDLQIQGGLRHTGDWRRGVAEMANDAMASLTKIPPVAAGKTAKEIAAGNAAIEANLQQTLDIAKGNPLTKPSTVKLLEANLAAFQSSAANAADKASKGEAGVTLNEAPSQAEAERQRSAAGELGKNTGAAGQSQVDIAARKKQAELQAETAAEGNEWKPKVTQDEKKKAELAENISFNANEVNAILNRRPDLLGTVAGRYTNAKQMMGNNDPDISAIGTHIHNIAMANSGVHGFRSQEGVEATEQNLLNHFKNGAVAVAGSLKANTDSVQTFIDNARPEKYQTHSKQGGAAFYYQGQSHAQQITPQPGQAHPVIVNGQQIGVTRDGGKTMTAN